MTKTITTDVSKLLYDKYKDIVVLLKNLRKYLPEDKIKKLISESREEVLKKEFENCKDNDFETFKKDIRKPENQLYKKGLDYKIILDNKNKIKAKVTYCAWVDTFKKLNATDLGYLLVCEQDFKACEIFNPKIKLQRTKTLMQGDKYCDHCWVY
jgi:hypothetical protein